MTYVLDTEVYEPVAGAASEGAALGGSGEAPTVVLGHSLGSSAMMWQDVILHLRRWARVVTYNLPGHGGSQPFDLGRSPAMADVLDALDATLKQLRVVNYHLAGLSFGGLTALAAGVRSLPGLRSIAVMSSGPVNAPLEQWPEKAATARAEGSTAGFVEGTFQRWFTEDAPEEAVERVRTAFLGCHPDGYAQACEVLGTTDLTAEVRRITVPTLLVSAENDGALPWDAADALAEDIHRGGAEVRVVKLEGVKHMSAVERPAEVAEALKGFVLGR